MLFQEAGIPEFERKNLPLVWRGKTLIYVGGVGSEVREQVDDDGTPRYKIEFIKIPAYFLNRPGPEEFQKFLLVDGKKGFGIIELCAAGLLEKL